MTNDGPIAYYFNFNRIEVIDHTGRAYVYWADKPVGVEIHQQDQGRTIKVFINGEAPERGYLSGSK